MNPYKSPQHVDERTQGSPGARIGLPILAASVVATTVVNVIRLPYADEVRIAAAVASISGAIWIFNRVGSVVRVPAAAGICGCLVGYGAALATLFIPPPPGGVLLFPGLDGAAFAFFIISGVVALLVGALQAVAETGVWMLCRLIRCWMSKNK